MSDSALEPVKDHLREHPHPHLRPEMVASNATVVDDSQRPEALVFDVEKRRNALGARYRKNRPPAAFETYWERYCYDPHTGDLHRLGTNVAKDQNPTVTVNSIPGLLKDYLESVLGLLDRAWPGAF